MRNRKFIKRIGAGALAACMVVASVGCGSSSGKGAAEGTTGVKMESQSKILVAAAASLQATFDNELIPLFENAGPTCVSEGICREGAMSCGRLDAILAAKQKQQ